MKNKDSTVVDFSNFNFTKRKFLDIMILPVSIEIKSMIGIPSKSEKFL
jgi:hypothetical protein